MASRNMEQNKACSCKECHKTFYAVRYNAEFCSTTCRKRRQRRLERIDDLMNAAFHAIEELSKYHDGAGHFKAFQAMERIAKRSASVRDYLDDFPDATVQTKFLDYKGGIENVLPGLGSRS